MEPPHVSEIDLGSYNPILVDFVRDFDALLCLYKELETVERTSLRDHLFKIGSQVKEGRRFWTKSDVNAIIQWKKLQPLWRRIAGALPVQVADAVHAFYKTRNETRNLTPSSNLHVSRYIEIGSRP